MHLTIAGRGKSRTTLTRTMSESGHADRDLMTQLTAIRPDHHRFRRPAGVRQSSRAGRTGTCAACPAPGRAADARRSPNGRGAPGPGRPSPSRRKPAAGPARTSCPTGATRTIAPTCERPTGSPRKFSGGVVSWGRSIWSTARTPRSRTCCTRSGPDCRRVMTGAAKAMRARRRVLKAAPSLGM